MSWLDDLSGLASSVGNFFSGDSLGGQIAKTALTGYSLYKVQQAVNKDNQKPAVSQTMAPDPGVRLQVNPDPTHKIPVVYGTATIGGIITDATITNSNKTMWYAITLCERTGIKLSDNIQSEVSFEQLYWDDQRIVFKADGVTVNYTVDRDGNNDNSLSDLVQVFCYSGGSGSGDQVAPLGYSITPATAYSRFPIWTSTDTMNNLVFVLVKVDYNREKNLKKIGTIKAKLTNTMTKPGDCIFDYMTDTSYGANISPGEIYSA